MILFEDRASIVLEKVLKKIKQKKFLLPLNVCPVVPDTFIKANKQFEFIDINLETLCMDYDLILDKIRNDSTIDGVLFVKTFGIEIDTEPFFKELKDINHNIFIIDDMCPSIPRFNYQIENSYSDLALFSSGYSKYVDIGYGGYGFLKNNKFINIFQDVSENKDFIEYKKRILKEVASMKVHKEVLNNIYKNGIPEKYHLGEQFNNWRFSLLIDNKEDVLQAIFENKGLFASSHYPQVDYDYVEYPLQNSKAKRIHDKIINLFNDFRFTKEQAYLTVAIINKIIKGS